MAGACGCLSSLEAKAAGHGRELWSGVLPVAAAVEPEVLLLLPPAEQAAQQRGPPKVVAEAAAEEHATVVVLPRTTKVVAVVEEHAWEVLRVLHEPEAPREKEAKAQERAREVPAAAVLGAGRREEPQAEATTHEQGEACHVACLLARRQR